MDVDLSRWGDLVKVRQIPEGNRNEVWLGELDGSAVSIRRSRRAEASLQWELDLIDFLDQMTVRVPVPVRTIDGQRSVEGVVVQRWLVGHPPASADEWHLVAKTLGEIHQATSGYRQRPGACMVTELDRCSVSLDADMSAIPDDVANELLSVFATFGNAPVAVVHGDVGASNIRIGPDQQVGLLDFDESRVDVWWLDLCGLELQVLDDSTHRRAEQLSHAWEVANGWALERDYVHRRLRALRASRDD